MAKPTAKPVGLDILRRRSGSEHDRIAFGERFFWSWTWLQALCSAFEGRLGLPRTPSPLRWRQKLVANGAKQGLEVNIMSSSRPPVRCLQGISCSALAKGIQRDQSMGVLSTPGRQSPACGGTASLRDLPRMPAGRSTSALAHPKSPPFGIVSEPFGW